MIAFLTLFFACGDKEAETEVVATEVVEQTDATYPAVDETTQVAPDASTETEIAVDEESSENTAETTQTTEGE